MLQHRRPAIGDGAVEVLFQHFIELDLFVFFFRAVDHAAHVGIDKSALAGLGNLCALQLPVLAALPVTAAVVGHDVFNIDNITAAVKGKALDDFHTFRAAPHQRDHQCVGTVLHAPVRLFDAVDRVVGRLRTTGGTQAGLDDKQVRQAVVQQSKGGRIRFGGGRVVKQVGLAQVAAGRVDANPEQIGFNLDGVRTLQQIGLGQGGTLGDFRRRLRTVVFDPGLPQQQDDERKRNEQKQALVIHGCDRSPDAGLRRYHRRSTGGSVTGVPAPSHRRAGRRSAPRPSAHSWNSSDKIGSGYPATDSAGSGNRVSVG